MTDSEKNRHFHFSALLRALSVKGGPIDGNCEVVFGPGAFTKGDPCKMTSIYIHNDADESQTENSVGVLAQRIISENPGQWKMFAFNMEYKPDSCSVSKKLSVYFSVVPVEPVQLKITPWHRWPIDYDSPVTKGTDRVHISHPPILSAAKSKLDDNLLLLLIPPIK